MIMLAIAAAAIADPLAPALTRVTTSFQCGGPERSITISMRPGGVSIDSLATSGRALARAQIMGVRSSMSGLDRIDETTPQCGDGPDRILIRGRSGDRKRRMMIFFGPNGAAAAREVG